MSGFALSFFPYCHSAAGNYLLGWQQTQQRESSMEMNVITSYMHGLNYHQTPELLALQLIKTAFKINPRITFYKYKFIEENERKSY